MRFVHSGHFRCSFHYFLLLHSINTHYFHSVAWLYQVHVVIIRNDCNGMWCLSFRYEFWQLLKFYELLISKLTQVVNNFVTVSCQTFAAYFGFLHFGILENNPHVFLTFYTTEACTFHLWYHI